MITGEGEPVRWKVPISSSEDLSIRVVRSTSGIIDIPELGVTVEPGPACEGFVSNVEGILSRVMEAVESVISWAEGDDLARALEVRKKIFQAMEGDLPFTLVIEDPCGNSAILDTSAAKERYEPEEDSEKT
jgi:zinc finger protein